MIVWDDTGFIISIIIHQYYYDYYSIYHVIRIAIILIELFNINIDLLY